MSRAGLRGAALPRSWLLRNPPGRGNHDCLHWLQLLIKPPSVQLAPQEEHSLPHSVPQLLFFMFIGIRWLVERATPRHAHPVRSAEETTAATCCPLWWELQAVATISPGHASPACLPAAHPPTPAPRTQYFASVPAPASCLPKLLFINTDQNVLLPAETHMAMVLPPHTLPSTHSHVLFATVKAVLNHTPWLLPTQLFPLLGVGPSFSHVLYRFSYVYMCTRGRGSHLGSRPAYALFSDLGCQSPTLQLCDLGQLT